MIPKSGNKSVDTALSIAIIIAIVYALNLVLKVVNKAGGFIDNPLGIPEESGGTSDQTAKPEKSNLTHPLNQYSAWCDEIEDIIWDSGVLPSWGSIYTNITGDISTNDEYKIIWIMKQANNIDDVQQMIKEYGRRGRGIVLQDYPNLVQTLRQYLEPQSLDAINYDYQLKKIPYTF